MQQSWRHVPVNAFFKSAIRGQASTWNGGSLTMELGFRLLAFRGISDNWLKIYMKFGISYQRRGFLILKPLSHWNACVNAVFVLLSYPIGMETFAKLCRISISFPISKWFLIRTS